MQAKVLVRVGGEAVCDVLANSSLVAFDEKIHKVHDGVELWLVVEKEFQVVCDAFQEALMEFELVL
jgi:hypothetical protein